MSKVEKWKSGKPRYKIKKNAPYLRIIRIKITGDGSADHNDCQNRRLLKTSGTDTCSNFKIHTVPLAVGRRIHIVRATVGILS